MKPYLLGIDIGTSSCKIAVFSREGQVIASANEKYPVFYPKQGWAEQDSNEWWDAVCRATKAIFSTSVVKAEEIAGIGIDGQSWSAIPINKKGEVLANTPIWMDIRAADICQEYNEKIGKDRIFQLTGNSLQPSYTTSKIIWYKRNMPQMYETIDKVLQSNGFIVYKLTGRVTQDLSQGYGLHCFDMRRGTWNDEMCKALGITSELLPKLYSCHEVVGGVGKKASEETGLLAGTPVVAGGLDAACATLGAGVIHSGETQEQGGQAGGMSICIDRYKADQRLILSHHVVPGKWLIQGGTTGGAGVMRWLEQEFADYEKLIGERSGKSSLELFNSLAEQVEPGSDGMVFLPYMSGERSPIWNPHAKGVYYGLDFGKTKGHFIRAAMEGVAFSLRHNLDVAEQAGAGTNVLRAVGGAANSGLWTQIKSDVTGKPIIVPASDTATTLGAAILAGVGVGMYSGFDEAVKLTVVNKRYHIPNEENRKRYDHNYDVYLRLYENLQAIMDEKGGV